MAIGIFTIISIVLSVVSVIMSITAKPKKRDAENTIQRQGLNKSLERLYGTRKMSMVITDAKTSKTQRPFWYESGGSFEDTVGISIKHTIAEQSPSGPNTTGTSYTEPRNNFLRFQGPICVSGRLNAEFSPEHRQLEDFDVKVDGKSYSASELNSWTKWYRTGAGWAVYLKGGMPDDLLGGPDSSRFSNVIHGYGEALLELGEGKPTFAGIPEYEFTMRSNKLFDPTTDTKHEDPATWTGRLDNPVLQVLDYMLDKQFGAGIDIEEIDLESFKLVIHFFLPTLSPTVKITLRTHILIIEQKLFR